MRIVVIDTNVLLSQPDVVNSFSNADVVIPEMVLSEIDKLKTARVDPDLRYKGRQVSRILFELSERGNLHDGVELPGGSSLRIVGLDHSAELPKGLTARNTDDRIIAVAASLITDDGPPVTLVTNDLNMLLKAQTYHLEVERVETDDSFMRRFVVRPFQRYRPALSILAVALAVFAAAIYLTLFSPFSSGRQVAGLAGLPPDFVEQLSVEQQQALNYLFRLQSDPKNVETLVSLATVYDNLAQQDATYLPYGVKYWEKVLAITPGDNDARTDLALDYFHQQKIDQAIKELNTVLVSDPEHLNANLNLGIMYMNTTPKQFQRAANQFERVMALTKGNADQAAVYQHGQAMLAEVKKEAAAAGQPIQSEGSVS